MTLRPAVRYPPSPKRGDRVAIVSPSSGLPGLFPTPYELGLQRLRDEFDVVPVEYPTMRRMWGHWANRALALLSAALLLTACAAAPVPVAPPPAHPTAASACGVGEGWQVAVEIDRPDGSALALVSGDSIAECVTWRNAERTGFGNTVSGAGLYPVGSPPALTYATSMAFANGPPGLLIGRVPPRTRTVRLVLADGSEQTATIGGDIWLVWLVNPGEPTLIEALDASGASIARMADPNGIQPAG